MWPNPQKTADLVTFTEEILNGKLYFLCSVNRVPNSPLDSGHVFATLVVPLLGVNEYMSNWALLNFGSFPVDKYFFTKQQS